MTLRPASDRLIFLLDTVRREGEHLIHTTQRLLPHPVDTTWVAGLEEDPDRAERLDAFVARFSRMQDTLGDRLLPELLRQMLETPGSALDNLNRLEKLGLLASVVDWVEARNLRNRLVHEYMRDAEEFAGAVNRARELVPMLINTFNTINRYAREHFSGQGWPGELSGPSYPS
ncbi:hypothetical protein ACN2MM_04955 [Alkalilimnicola ehrlichii MLHE-1]|uniref:DUF86 domain-containing protein n=1 Tax=Alkalilimnicola ehrlichii (strain ATCC BAA-1101 / DSM 17681 / MLHE-1) TaxID=187272 RepID=Q0AAB9_ALKEH|nr:hypothetical protein [Alkalilimnicola ehrlichii]ABI56218.1 hypothetical protein Mlg_0864 [Alkalilimnicola ehrlichii MLHE-1]